MQDHAVVSAVEYGGQIIVGGESMKGLPLLLILWAGTSFAQSPFDGSWIIDSDSTTVSEKPVVFGGKRNDSLPRVHRQRRNQSRWG
jgi:hypothetical protein